MIVEQIYTGCLAEAAYYVESKGEAAIIDPLREVEPYIQMAKKNNAVIKYVFETHFHADFVSGHIDLAKKTGATIIYGPTATPHFDAYVSKDEETFLIGDIKIKVLHTPGHTMESSTFLLINEEGNDYAIFTGDTLFIGDVGRPDLAVQSDLTKEDLAGHLFHSLRNKIMPLSDRVIVYPGHGAGSACGKKMSNETIDTLGHQKRHNYALNPDLSREDFIKEVTEGLVAPPQYFPKNAVMNKMGYASIDDILNRGVVGLDPQQFKSMVKRNNALLLDTRPAEQFIEAFIPGSIWIGIDHSFAPWVGALVEDIEQPIVFLAEKGKEQEVVTRLARVGYDHALGYLEGGLKAWKDAGFITDTLNSIGPHDFTGIYDTEFLHVLDVRKKSEYDAQHITGTLSFPLDFIHDNLNKLEYKNTYYVHCQGGYRSLIACSILKSMDYDVVNIEGGLNEIKKSCVKVTTYREPATML